MPFAKLLKTAEVTQKRNRVIATANLSPSFLSQITNSENSVRAPATPRSQDASK